MKIRFDAAACTGHGRCYALGPEIFDADDQGHCLAHGQGDGWKAVDVEVALEAKARLAAVNCPEDALTVE